MLMTEILEKFNSALAASPYDALLLSSPAAIQYLTGVDLPFALYRPGQPIFLICQKNQPAALFCPAEWALTARETGWIEDVRPYTLCGEDASQVMLRLAEWAQALPAGAAIGLEMDHLSDPTARRIQALQADVRWLACDAWLRDLRAVKTSTEIELLEEAATLTDHGINGAIHHVTIDRRTSCLTLAEELRVHTEERGIDLSGYHACAHINAGSEMKTAWSNPPKYGYSKTVDLHPKEAVRMKIQTRLNGYWADATRMMVMGELSAEQSESYQKLVTLRRLLLDAIRPGVPCSQVFQQVQSAAAASGIEVDSGQELGHSIGVTPCEPPYLSPCDSTILRENMVLVLDPLITDSAGQIWRSKDTIVIHHHGCRVIGWYKDWDEPYLPIESI